jgi:hypothetical protein
MYLLKIFEYQLEIGPVWSGLRFLLPYWRVPLQELTVAEAVTRRRIRFRTKGDFRVFSALAWRRDDVLLSWIS